RRANKEKRALTRLRAIARSSDHATMRLSSCVLSKIVATDLAVLAGSGTNKVQRVHMIICGCRAERGTSPAGRGWSVPGGTAMHTCESNRVGAEAATHDSAA